MKKPKETFDKWFYTVCNSSDSRVELAKKAFDRGRKFEKDNMDNDWFYQSAFPHTQHTIVRTKYIG